MPSDASISGMQPPRFFYGTAWKQEQTAAFTLAALRAGFRAIDTANQRKYYHGRVLARV